MRVIDAMLAFPPIIFAIAVVGTFGAGRWTASAAIGVLIAPRFFRIVRAETLGLVGAQYVEAAELVGASKLRVLRVHVARKVVPTIAVTSATTMAEALLAVSALAFLGLGPPAPAATWGGMLADDLTYLSQDAYAAIWPGLAIMITVAALNAIADGVRDSSTVACPRRGVRRWRAIPEAASRRWAMPLSRAAAARRRPAHQRPVPGGGRAEAVHGVSFTVRRGEAVGLVGESGSGKTLTCRAVLGVLPPASRSPAAASPSASCGSTALAPRVGGRARAAHRRGLPGSDVVPEPLAVGREPARRGAARQGRPRPRAPRGRAVELLDLMGIHHPEHVFGQVPAQLSGGMLQRVMIAIAVSCDPELVVADEATTALDVTTEREVIDLLRALRQRIGISVLMVSHDLAVVAELCDRIVVFYAGEVVESGPVEQIVSDPRHPYTQALLRVASLGDGDHRASR